MKIAVAQTKPFKGDIEKNIAMHIKMIMLAVSGEADMIIFPELSITGYEPQFAKTLATDKDDKRFGVFQDLSNEHHIVIGAGMPVKAQHGVMIGMIIFQPHKERSLYTKQYLHEDEFPFFVPGSGHAVFSMHGHKIAFAICYELSVEEHFLNANQTGADIYIASVAKSVSGVEKSLQTLSGIARQYGITALMSNCIGHCDNFDCGGKTAAWNKDGSLAAQLGDSEEGLLIFDTATQGIIKETF